MMEIFGWIVMFAIGLYIGLFVILTIGNMGGTYNIGGVPNKWWEKLLALIVFPVVYGYGVYYLIILTAPFSITFN